MRSTPNIGLDPLSGLIGPHLLFHPLINFFHNQGLFVIKDITNEYISSPTITHWKDTTKLEIPVPLVQEWTTYISYLKLSRIALSIKEDIFIYFSGSQQGKVTVNEEYWIIFQPFRNIFLLSWLARCWKLNFPIKLKCFSWLVAHN